MNAQTTQDASNGNAGSTTVLTASADFDGWANAVRKQMLSCLQKRGGGSRSATHR